MRRPRWPLAQMDSRLSSRRQRWRALSRGDGGSVLCARLDARLARPVRRHVGLSSLALFTGPYRGLAFYDAARIILLRLNHAPALGPRHLDVLARLAARERSGRRRRAS